MITGDQTMNALMGGDSLQILSMELHSSGDAWARRDAIVEGAIHCTWRGELYASDQTGKAESYLANWCRARLRMPVRQVELTGAGLSESQIDAANLLLGSPACALTGGPGTGKTYTARTVVESFVRAGGTVMGCAPTGAAALRLQESIGITCATIHRMLRYRQGMFTLPALLCDVVVIDEASMLSADLLLNVVSRMGKRARLIMIGDPNQLPSVDPGCIFAEMIKVIPTANLSEIRRTDADSPIGIAASMVLRGEVPTPDAMPSAGGNGGYMNLQCARLQADAQTRIRNHPLTVAERFSAIEGEPLQNVRVLAASNAACDKINADFDSFCNVRPREIPILIVKNLYDVGTSGVFNGDIGIERWRQGGGILLDVRGERVTVPAKLTKPGQCITTHRSQGNEYLACVVWVESCSTRNGLYTAITRGKKRVAVCGPPEKLRAAVEGVERPRLSLFSALFRGDAVIEER